MYGVTVAGLISVGPTTTGSDVGFRDGGDDCTRCARCRSTGRFLGGSLEQRRAADVDSDLEFGAAHVCDRSGRRTDGR